MALSGGCRAAGENLPGDPMIRWRKKVGILLLLLALPPAIWSWRAGKTLPSETDLLSDHDYSIEIRAMMASGGWEEAEILCDDILAAKLPEQETIRQLREECRLKRTTLNHRIYKTGKGFFSGDPDGSWEEVSGSIFSDLVLYGDIRDFAVHGWKKAVGKDYDPVILFLAAAGIATEFVDFADVIPAVLKWLKKSGSLTPEIVTFLSNIGSRAVKSGRIAPEGRKFFADVRQIFENCGWLRCRNLFRCIRSADEAALFAEYSAKHPHLVHLLVRHGGDQSAEVLRMLRNTEDPVGVMQQIARKGSRLVKIICRSGKIIKKDHPGKAWGFYLGKSGYFISLLLFFSGICLLGGLPRKKPQDHSRESDL